MKVSNYTVEINRPLKDVWNKLSQIEDWPTWDKSLVWCKFSESFNNDSQGSLKPAGGPSTTFKIVNFVALKRFDVCSSLPLGNRLIIGHYIDESKGKTQLTHSIEIVGCCSWLFVCLIGRKLRKALPEAMEELKRVLECQSKKPDINSALRQRREAAGLNK